MSAGLQEALNQCNAGAGRCIVQLRADTTYTIPARSTWTTDSFTECNAETNGDDDIWIRGHGPSSVLSFVDGVVATGTTSRMLCVTSGSKNIVISDFVMKHNVTACTSSCGTVGSATLYIGGEIDDVTVERMQILPIEAVTTDAATASLYGIYIMYSSGTNPDTIPHRVKIKDNLIQTSTRGVQMIACDWCEVSGNSFTAAGVPNDGTSPPSVGLMALYDGTGTAIRGNSFNMMRDGQGNVTFSGAIILHRDQGGSGDAAGMNRGALVEGNTITGLRTQDQYGVWVIGYSSAGITDNTIQAGVCSASATRSCTIDEDCSDLGGTCDTAPARGVHFDTGQCVVGVSCNLGNAIKVNTFDGFQDTGDNCPVSFSVTGGAQHAQTSTKNDISGNTFRLNTTTDDGICGTEVARINANNIVGNYVVGGTLGMLRSGTATLGTTEIVPGACATLVTEAATGVTSSDVIQWTPNQDISTIVGYNPASTGALSIYPYPGSGNVNFKVCNPTSGNITPGAAVILNWRVER